MPPATPEKGQRGASSLQPSETPVKTLNLNLPKVTGARAIAAPSLLAPSAGAPSPESAVLQSMLQTFLRSDQPAPSALAPGGPTSLAGLPPSGTSAAVGPMGPSFSGAAPGAGGGEDDELRRLIEALLGSVGAPPQGPNIIPGVGGPETPPPAPPTPPPAPPPGPGPIETPPPRFPGIERGTPTEFDGGEDILRRFGFL